MNLHEIKDIPTGGKYCEKCGQWVPLINLGKCDWCTITQAEKTE